MRLQADLIKIFKHVAGGGDNSELDIGRLSVKAVTLFVIDTLGRAQAAKGLPLLGANACFCTADGSVQPYTHTREFKTYGSSFFVAPDGRSKDSDRLVVMSTFAISKASRRS